MKLLIALFLLSFNVFAVSAADWRTNFNESRQEATNTHKLILLNFSGSDWCGPCVRMKTEIFKADVFNTYAENHLVLVNADFPRSKKNQLTKEQVKQNEALADKYNKEGRFPFTVLLDENGKILKQWEGYPNESPEKFVEEITSLKHAAS